jgi:CRP-like cAMP-binding protein
MGTNEEQNSGECISGNLAVCAFIERSHLFKRLKREDLTALYEAGKLKSFKSGEVVVGEGDAGNSMFLIVTGTVQVITGPEMTPVKLAQLKRGAFFGEVSLLTGRPRTATVVAVNDVELIAFSKQAMEPILRKYPRVRMTIEKSKDPT